MSDELENIAGERLAFRNLNQDEPSEQYWHKQEKILNVIFNNPFQFIGLLAADGRVLEANQILWNLEGIRYSDAVGRKLWEIEAWRMSAVAQTQLQAAIAQAVTGEFSRCEVKTATADGSPRIVDFSFKPIIGESDEAISLIAEGRDITEIKQAQASLQTLNQELEIRFQERTTQLQTTIQQLEAEIEQHKQTATKLRESEARFQKLAANIPGMIYQIHCNTEDVWNFHYINNHCWEIYEIEPETMMANPSLLWTMVHPEDLPSFQQSVAKGITHLQPWQWEGRILLQSGKIKWIQVISRPEKSSNGEHICNGLILDISSRKRAEEQQAQLLAAIEASIDGIAILNLTSEYTYLNHSHLQLYGYDNASELIGKSWQALYEPEEMERLEREAVRGLLEQGNWRGEGIGKKRDGSLFPQEISLTLMANGYYICICHDISKRKQTEAALRESEARLQAILDHCPAMIYLIDRDDQMLLVNRTYENALSKSKAEIIGCHISEIWPADIAKQFIAANHEVLRSGSSLVKEDTISHNGQQQTFLTIKFPLKNVEGVIYAIGGICTDISGRKRAESALRESELRLRVALAAAEMGTWDSDLSTGKVTWSEKTELIFGMAPGSFPGTQAAFINCIHPEDREQVSIQINRALAEKMAHNTETRIVWPDGTIRWIACIGNILCSPNGEPQLLTGVVMDITERKRVEAALRESEEKFRSIFYDAPIGMGLITPEGKCTQVNPALQKLLGYTEAELKELTFDRISHQEDLEREKPYIQQCLRGELTSYRIEKRYIQKNGEPIWVNLTSSLVLDRAGNLCYALGMVEDITERKQVEEALKLRERAIAASSNGIIISDARLPDSPMIYANPAFERITGYSNSEVLGKNCRFLQGKETLQPELEILRSTLQTGEGCTVILRNYRKDGTLFWNELSISPILDNLGNLTHFIGIITDITERKQAEEVLLLAQGRLQFLLSSSPAVIYSAKVDGDYGTTFMSDNIKTLMGYEARDFTGNPHFWLQRIYPKDQAQVLAGFSSLFERGYHIDEYRFLHKDGTYRWVRDQMKLIRNAEGKPLEIVGYWADINDRRQAELALQQAKDQLQAVLDAVPGFVSWVSYQAEKDSELRYGGVNQQLATAFNLTAEEFRDQPLNFAEENFEFAEFMQRFFASASPATTEIINLTTHDSNRHYLIAAQKYQKGTAAVSVAIDITEQKDAEAKLRASLKEKEVLLKEIHHRVKNNLQIVSSLLKLQASYIRDQEVVIMFTDSYNRVRSMALIHEKLYSSPDLGRIDPADYIQNLVTNLLNSYRGFQKNITSVVEVDSNPLDIDTALPCGLIINELVSNSLKYAFPDPEKTGQISVFFKEERQQEYLLKISDDGIGLPLEFEWEKTESLGLQLVWNLAEQLNGRIELDRSNGTEFLLRFYKS